MLDLRSLAATAEHYPELPPVRNFVLDSQRFEFDRRRYLVGVGNLPRSDRTADRSRHVWTSTTGSGTCSSTCRLFSVTVTVAAKHPSVRPIAASAPSMLLLHIETSLYARNIACESYLTVATQTGKSSAMPLIEQIPRQALVSQERHLGFSRPICWLG